MQQCNKLVAGGFCLIIQPCCASPAPIGVEGSHGSYTASHSGPIHPKQISHHCTFFKIIPLLYNFFL